MYSSSYKRYITILLLTVYVFNQVDRAVFGILMEPIKHDLGLSDTQLGFLAGPALTLFYATFGIPIARWADGGHRINIMSMAVALWSGIVTLSASVQTFWQFAAARVGVGVGEAGFSAVAQSVIADYHTSAERTRALSIFMLAVPIGQTVSYMLGGWGSDLWGWRAVFIAAGAPGIVLALVMKWTVQEPRRIQVTVAPEPVVRPPLSSVFATLWRRRALRHLSIGMALFNLLWGALVWKAAFFIRIHGASTGEIGTWLAIVMAAGGGTGIWLSANLTTRFKVTDERRQTQLLALNALAAAPLLIAALLWPTQTGALLLLLAAVVSMNFFFAPATALIQGLCPTTMRATMVAISIFLQHLCLGVIGLQLTGILSDAMAAQVGSQSLRWAMVCMAPASLWAAVHFWLAGRSIRQDLLDAAAQASLPESKSPRQAPLAAPQ